MKKLLLLLLVVSMSSLYADKIPRDLNVSTNFLHQDQEESSSESAHDLENELGEIDLDSLEEVLRSGELEDGGYAAVLVMLIIAFNSAWS